jgi:hypothetical protein
MNCLEERHQGSKELYNEREKTALRCIRAEIELSQPQFYGTSYLLVRIALTDHKPPEKTMLYLFVRKLSTGQRTLKSFIEKPIQELRAED